MYAKENINIQLGRYTVVIGKRSITSWFNLYSDMVVIGALYNSIFDMIEKDCLGMQIYIYGVQIDSMASIFSYRFKGRTWTIIYNTKRQR